MSMSADADAAAVGKAIASTQRPPRASALATALAFGWRGMLKVKHVPEQLVDVTITPVLFLLMFTYLFGGEVTGSTAEYLDYVLPGVLCMSVIFTTVYSGIALNTDLTKGVVDRFRSLPIWRPAPLVGALLGDAVRYVVAATVIMIVGLILTSTTRAGGRRQYDEAVLRRLDVIAFAKESGLTLAEIRSLLSGPGHATDGRHALTRRKLEEVNARIARAEAMRDLLQASLACDCAALEQCPAVRAVTS